MYKLPLLQKTSFYLDIATENNLSITHCILRLEVKSSLNIRQDTTSFQLKFER